MAERAVKVGGGGWIERQRNSGLKPLIKLKNRICGPWAEKAENKYRML